jgi:hypothetical protein
MRAQVRHNRLRGLVAHYSENWLRLGESNPDAGASPPQQVQGFGRTLFRKLVETRGVEPLTSTMPS